MVRMNLAARRFSSLLRADLEPLHWLGTTPTLDLADDRLRMRAQALTQLAGSDRERALALYQYVKAIKLGFPTRLRYPTARQILDSHSANNYCKSTLLVAFLRLVKIPARIRMVRLRGDILQGLYNGLPWVNYSLVEVWLHQRWVKTDSYTCDSAYLGTARHLLEKAGWERGYCIVRQGAAQWDGEHDALAALSIDEGEHLPLIDFGVFNDPLEFISNHSEGAGTQAYGAVRGLHFRVVAGLMHRQIRKLRQEPMPAQWALKG